MAEERSNQQQTGEDVSADLRRTGWVFIPLMALGVVAILFKAGASGAVATTYLMWALSCLISGAAVGFLFGIPKILQADRPAEETQAAAAYRQQVNTNLEQISDWLTKIIVGLGLINLTSIPPYLGRMAGLLAAGTGDERNTSFALALIVYFSLLGFLSGYLSTRLFLASAFSKADQLAAEARREGLSLGAAESVNQLRAMAKKLDPKLFRRVLNEIHPEALVEGEPAAGTSYRPPAGRASPSYRPPSGPSLRRPPGTSEQVEAEEADAEKNERETLEDVLTRLRERLQTDGISDRT